jgi:hypothetical protein
VTGVGLPLDLHFLVLREVCLEEREVELLRNDELHDEQSIHRGLLVDNVLLHLLVDINHDIKWIYICGLSLAVDLMRIG